MLESQVIEIAIALLREDGFRVGDIETLTDDRADIVATIERNGRAERVYIEVKNHLTLASVTSEAPRGTNEAI